MAIIDAGPAVTDTAADTDTERAPRDPATPPGPVVAPAATASAADEARVGRGFVVGSALGFVAVFTLYTSISVVAGVPIGAALGVGLFTAFWGGPGFGGMLGAVLAHERHGTDA